MSRSLTIDRWLDTAWRASAWCVCALALLVVGFVTDAAWPLLKEPASWLGSAQWRPLDGRFGLLAMLAASLVLAALALALAVPLGLLAAIWGRFYAPRWGGLAYRAAMGVMASIPSVVYGLWGLAVLVPLIGGMAPPGSSLLAGSLLLALVLAPIIVLQADLALDDAAKRHWAGALAVGASRWGAIRRVLLPACWARLRSTLLLQTGRALGETMALLMVCGNVVQWPASLFDPVRALTANIALEMPYAGAVHQVALFASGWLLMAAVLLLVVAARTVERRGADAPR